MNDEFDAPRADPLLGRVIEERFRVDAKIGQGGMGAIYLAEHLLLKKKVAIKCLHAGLASNPDVVRRFKNEAVAASSIGHPNIVDVMDMGRFEDGTFFMVLEFLDGRDFQHDLDESKVQSVEQVAHVGVQVCAALGAAAAKGIVHRDLKPENIFLIELHGDKSFVKILDFGISKIRDGSGGATKTGELMGTPYYMAPEQVLGERDITHLADVYALGVIFFQALSGGVPFEGNTLAQVLLKIATEPAPSLGERAPGLPTDLVGLVDQMTQKDPSARPQSFQEIASRLVPFLPAGSAFLGEIGSVSRSLSAGPSGGRKDALPPSAFGKTQLGAAGPGAQAGQKKAPPWGIVAAVLVVLAILGWFVFGSSNDASEASAEPETKKESAETVRVRITTVPADAEVRLDGSLLTNPFDGDLPKDDESHELVVKKEGYEPETRTLTLVAAQRITVSLDKKAAAQKAATQKAPAQESGSGSQSAPRPSSSNSGSRSGSGSGSGSESGNKSAPKPIRDLERGLRKIF